MAGIIFFRTTMLQDIVNFYVNEIGLHIWLEQAECVILNHGNLLLGFCERETPETEGIITLFYPTKEDVDVMYDQLKHISTSEPIENDRYEIYQFFGEDPEGRALEFQAFLHPIEPVGFF
ncbi:VOC family protein [Candidatus Thorarchaeota archaeon]|nr:MAG: VOC family protein [Candidatus Thorarchaeota archaeon]